VLVFLREVVERRRLRLGSISDAAFRERSSPALPPSGARCIVGEQLVDRDIACVERPERVRLCRKAETRKDRAAHPTTKPTALYRHDLQTQLAAMLGVPVKKTNLSAAARLAAKEGKPQR
jgi:hypothetical protein